MRRWAMAAGTLFTAGVFGAMAYVAAVLAPVTFATLPPAAAAAQMRAQFPPYYLAMATASGAAAAALVAVDRVSAAAMGASGIAFLAVRQGLLPVIAVARDRAEAGDAAAAARFAWLHRLSLAINLAQWIVSGGVLVRVAARGGVDGRDKHPQVQG